MRQKQSIFSLFLLSPSSRRAWIEITVIRISLTRKLVALLVEGVDRNGETWGIEKGIVSRPPHGGRG